VPACRLLALVLAAATTAVLAGCSGGHQGGATRPPALQVGYAFAYDTNAVADRIAFGRLRRRTGIAIRIRELGGVGNTVVALVRGEVQLATVPYSTAIRAVDEGAHLRVVLGANMASDFVLVARPGIDSVAALRGRRIGFDQPGLDGETLVREALAGADVPTSDVKLSALGEPRARADALAAGKVDAAVLDEVDYQRLLARGESLVVLARLSDVRPRSAQTVWVVSQSYEQAHRALLQRVVNGLLDGYAFVYTPAGGRAWIALARRSVLKGPDAAVAPRIYDFYRRTRFWPLRDRPVTPAQHARTVRFWVQADELKGPVPFARVWDSSFWRRAAAAYAHTA
jgi:ABC-type nitrate/sulfonate/bicarbonate transport system substrate-binding protein